MVLRIAIRSTGKRIKPYVTSAGSVARGKELAKHPIAQRAQACIKQNAGNRTKIRECMSSIKSSK